MLRPTVHSGLFAGGGIKLKPELGGYRHLLAERSEGFADESFICKRTVDFSGVEERDTDSTAFRIREIISFSSAAGP